MTVISSLLNNDSVAMKATPAYAKITHKYLMKLVVVVLLFVDLDHEVLGKESQQLINNYFSSFYFFWLPDVVVQPDPPALRTKIFF